MTLFDSEDDYGTGCRNVSHCQQQQSYSGPHSPGWSNSTYFLHPLFDNLLSFIPATLILSLIRLLYYKRKSIISWPLAGPFNFFYLLFCRTQWLKLMKSITNIYRYNCWLYGLCDLLYPHFNQTQLNLTFETCFLSQLIQFIGHGLTLSWVEFFPLFLSIRSCNLWFHWV